MLCSCVLNVWRWTESALESTCVFRPPKTNWSRRTTATATTSTTTTAPAIARLITRATTTSITASCFHTMGSLGWEQCRSNVTCARAGNSIAGPLMGRDPDAGPLGPLEGGVDMQVTLPCWSFELQRSCLISNPMFVTTATLHSRFLAAATLPSKFLG